MQTKSTLAFIGLATALMVSVSVAWAANIYVDGQLGSDITDGSYSIANRDNSGSDGDAYDTIQEAVDVVSAGDTIYIRSGTYHGSGGEVTPAVDMDDIHGTSANPILITNYSNETVVCDGTSPTELYFFQIEDCSYITLRGLKFQDVKRHGIRIVANSVGSCHHITVEYCQADGCGNTQTGHFFAAMLTYGPVHYVKFYRCLTTNCGNGIMLWETGTLSSQQASVPPIAGNIGYSEDLPEANWDSWEGWTSYGARYCTIEECVSYENYSTVSGNCDGISGRYPIECLWKNNISFDHPEDGLDVMAAVRCQFIGNYCFGGNNAGNGIKVGVRGGLDCVIARNVCFDNARGGIDAADTERAEIYNNTCYNNTNWFGIFTEAVRATSGGTKVINNACQGNGTGGSWGDMGRLIGPPAADIETADYNCLEDDNTHNFTIPQGDNSLISTDPLFLDADSNIDTDFGTGLTIPEKLTYIRDQVEDMFALASNSPCIDAGTTISGITDGYSGDAPDIGAFEYDSGTVGNTAPTADAGSDDECTLLSGVTLDGTVSDDGLPDPPASVTTTWSKVSGPGTVTFGDSSAVDTTATFADSGVYVLQLLADDGTATDSDTVQITVNHLAPTADAGSDDECTLPAGVTLDGTVSDDGYPLSPGSLTTTWSKDSGPGTVMFGDSAAVDTTAGFSTAGTYVLKLEVSDGSLSASDTVQVVVNAEPGGNVAPTANAGSDDEITLPSYATLDGTVSDDGLPNPPASVTTTWSKDSGPGTVTFGDSTAVDTTAGFSAAGTYVLKLEASDSDLSDSDTVQIVVNEEGTGVGPFQEEGGTVVMEAENYDDNDTRTDPYGANWSFLTTVNNYVGDGYMKAPVDAPYETGTWSNGCELGYDIDFETAGTYRVWLRRYANNSGYNSCHVGMDGTEIGSSFDNYTTGGSWMWINWGSPNYPEVYVSTGSHTFQIRRRERKYCVDRIILTTDSSYTPSGDGPAESSRSGGGPSNTAPTADAGSDDSITLPSNATLDGTVSDDGLPETPGSVTTTWTKQSGPGTVTFGDASAVDTTAGFSEDGVYVLKLEASDGSLSDDDTVQITVDHVAPTANAGSDDEITLPANATLDGTVSDDGFPLSPGSVTTTWTKQSGPGTVTFDDASVVDTTAGFSEAGTYVLRLTADDGDKTHYDDVTITVNAQNVAPTADAGSNDSITLPNYATLDGTVSDDGLPNPPATVTTTWSKDSGPGNVTFGDSSAVDTTAGFSENGVYVLQLTADDGTLTDSDTVQITVNHLAPTADAGSDDEIILPASVTLDGTISDDGFPLSPGSVTTTWTKSSGPGTVTFGNSAAVDTTAGFSAAGTYVLRLTADDGDKTDYDDVTITVNPQNNAPTADAGSDDECTVPNSVSLDGTISDDGLPDPPGAVTTTWSKVSGPGDVTFGDSSAVDTTAGFSTAGTYILKLEVSDSSLSDDDTVQIVANAAPSGSGPFIEEGGTVVMEAENYDDNETRSDPTGENYTLGTATAGYVSDGYMYPDDETTTNSTWANAAQCTYDIDFTNAGTYKVWLRRYCDDDGHNSCYVGFDGTQAGGTCDNTNNGFSSWYWYGYGTEVYVSAGEHTFNLRRRERGYKVDRIVLTKNGGTPSGNGPAESSRGEESNDAPTVAAGSDDECTLPSGVTLDGTVSDDGLPASPGSVTTTWTKSSGPGTVTFGNAAAVDTTAGFSEDGVYVLQLEASDGDLSDSDTVQITVNHLAPTAGAGSDDECTLPAGVTLDGTVSDDGYPLSPGSLTTTWTKDSGPGTVTFGDSSAVDTTAGFSEAGAYILQLEASDGDLSDSDTVAITVNAAAGGTGAFQEEGGTVVMEAENYDDNDTRTDPYDANWYLQTSLSNYVGDGYMKAPVGAPFENATWSNGCELGYDIDFETAGTYRVWLRRFADNSGYNSCHVGMDDTEIGTRFDNYTTGGSWMWINWGSPNYPEVYVSTGEHTFQIRRKERHYCIDRILLTTDTGYTPSGNGPAESSRQ